MLGKNMQKSIANAAEFATTSPPPQHTTLAAVIDDDGDNTMPFDGQQKSMNVDDYGLFRKLQAFIFNFRLQKFHHIH
jgi:hypothetical protein